MYYLGKYGSEASKREYDRIIAEFVANGRQPFYRVDEITVENLIVRYLDYVGKERDYSEGAITQIRRVLRTLNDLYGSQPVSQFGPAALKVIRRQFLDLKLSRDTINNYVSIIKCVFCWGCEEEIVPAEVAGALRTVESLKKGRTSAVDYADIEPVDEAVVDKTLPYLKPVVQAMVRVQRYISGRPQDIFNMRPCDIDRSKEVWKYVPATHKTAKLGKIRELPIGPKAQQVLKPYLDGCKSDRFVFLRPSGEPYDADSYRDQIESACRKAGVPRWAPNRLRHAGGTAVREQFGLEYAQSVLGHANAKMTEVYAKASYEKAEKVAKEVG